MSNLFATANAPTTEPVAILAGDYTSWRRTDLGSDYPNTSYTLQYLARREVADGSANKISITAAADGDDYLVELSTAITGAYIIGAYQWTAYIVRDSDSERRAIDSGRWTVQANKTNSSDDPRSHNRKMVDSIKAAIEARADNQQLDILAYDLGVDASATRDTTKLLKFLTTYEARLRAEVRRENAKKGKGGGLMKVRF